MRMLQKIVRFVLIVYFSLAIISALFAVREVFSQIQFSNTSAMVFLAGFILFSLIWILFLGRRGAFWSTLEHELTHALFAILFFKRIQSINANRFKGGWIKISGGNAVIALAPYIFPPATIFLLLLFPLLKSEFSQAIIFLLGFTLAFHYIGLIREVRFSQPDIYETGLWLSFTCILFCNMIFLYGLIFWLNNQPEIPAKLTQIFLLNIIEYVKQLKIILVSYL